MKLQKIGTAICMVGIGLLTTVLGSLVDVPNSVSTQFPTMQTDRSIINFDVQNNFHGIFLRSNNKTLSTPVSIVLSGSTIAGCTEQLQGLYYNNQRGLRLWPIDNVTLSGMQLIDSGYNNVVLSGGLYTNCSNVPANNVYGAIGTVRGGHTYRVIAGVDYNFTSKMRLPTFSGSFQKYAFTATGWIFDSQGAIGHIAGNTGAIVCGNSVVENGEQCDAGTSNGVVPTAGTSPVAYCSSSCTNATVGPITNNRGGGTTSTPTDTCPNGDFSSSYYDSSCGTAPTHTAPLIPEPVGKACKYSDEKYLSNGPFTDTITHRGYTYTEMMRISCLHRGRGTSKGLWLYEPDSSITRAEALKTFVKIMGIKDNDFSIATEDAVYPADTQFADVTSNHRFAWYVQYAENKGLLDGLVTTKNGKKYFNPDQVITRYEAIKVMMIAYEKINKMSIALSGTSVLGDVIDSNNPYYQYIREAEVLGFISGVPQKNGGYNFEGIREITRAEFAKIVSVPFTKELFDFTDLVKQSGLYASIVQSINKATSNKLQFVTALFKQLYTINDTTFMMQYKVQKKAFLDTLKETILAPLLEEQMKGTQ